MAEVDDNEERKFDHFLSLLPKLRMEIINEMKPDDRCRMTRCSKLLNNEVKTSKNFIRGLRLSCRSYCISIEVNFGYNPTGMDYGFLFDLRTYIGMKVARYANLHDETIWEVEIDNSIDVIEYSTTYFIGLLKYYQNSIKFLAIEDIAYPTDRDLNNIDFGIDKLSNLEYLELCDYSNVHQIISKLVKPLKRFSVRGESIDSFYDNEHIYRVQQYFKWENAQLNLEQFQKLSAPKVTTHIGMLTEHDIKKIVRSWQNGTIGKRLERYFWSLENSNFDTRKLSRLLRVDYRSWVHINVEHFKQYEKTATLDFNTSFIVFQN